MADAEEIIAAAKVEAKRIVSEAEEHATNIICAVGTKAWRVRQNFNARLDKKWREVEHYEEGLHLAMTRAFQIALGMVPNPLEGRLVSSAAISREVSDIIAEMKRKAEAKRICVDLLEAHEAAHGYPIFPTAEDFAAAAPPPDDDDDLEQEAA